MFEGELFIDLVKARPPLYNSTLVEYKSKPFCFILWKEIADVLKKDVYNCRSIWASMRSSYARHLQNMENNAKGINRKKKAPWYLAEKMSFLDEFMERTPRERNLPITHEDPNNTTTSGDDNSITFSNYEYKSDNNCTMDDSHEYKSDNNRSNIDDSPHSIVTIKSEESEKTLSCHEEEIIIDKFDDDVDVSETKIETEDPVANYTLMKKCRVELTSRDQNIENILTPKRKRKRSEVELPKEPVSKQFKMSSDELRLTAKEEIEDAKEREDSTLKFFKSILFDIRKLSDRKLRFLKQDILQDLNKYLDDDENED